jgi:hypothetical protein
MKRLLVIAALIGAAGFGVAYPVLSQAQRVTICHKAGDEQAVTIEVPQNAVAAHQAHGDTIGPCTGTPTQSPVLRPSTKNRYSQPAPNLWRRRLDRILSRRAAVSCDTRPADAVRRTSGARVSVHVRRCSCLRLSYQGKTAAIPPTGRRFVWAQSRWPRH